MTIADPRTAPARADLPFLKHRPRPVTTAPAAAAAVADFVRGTAPHPHPAAAAPAAASAPAPAAPVEDLLDLSAPAAPAAPAAPPGAPAAPVVPAAAVPPPAIDDLLDLSTPAPAAHPAPGAPAPGAPAPAAPAPTPAAPARAVRPVARAGPDAPTVLTPKDPTVTLTRIQSGVGILTFEAACSPAVGDLRLGCAYQLRSGVSSVVQYVSGVTTAPPKSSRPVLVAEHVRFERLLVDLVQSRQLERLILYAFSESGAQLNWGGTLVVTTFGGARVELPLDRPPSAQVNVMMSVYNIDGEFVLRAEMEQFPGNVRDAVSAYGFDRISWLDARTPLG